MKIYLGVIGTRAGVPDVEAMAETTDDHVALELAEMERQIAGGTYVRVIVVRSLGVMLLLQESAL